MAKKKKSVMPKRASDAGSPSRDQLEGSIQSRHKALSKLVQEHLASTGLRGLKVHSIRFSVAQGAVAAGSGCSPPCRADQQCVLDSNGGVVQWVCVSK